MSRELNIEIAELARAQWEGDWPWTGMDEDGCSYERVPQFSTDLNALMELIRRRWPKSVIELCADPPAAFIWRDWAACMAGSFDGPSMGESMAGDTDAERLAHAVKAALEVEK